ncbi:MAG: hypothetical protein KIT17_24420 [Rubrivivax sp.]|nr:hypothetical protein [Rubrivivax sp.]
MKTLHAPAAFRLLAGPLLAGVALGAAALEIQLPPPPPIVLPGLPGRVDVSRLPLPQVVLPSPVIIAPPPLPTPPRPGVVVAPQPRPQPVYMWVPPGHRKDWKKHCHKYRACGVPVYFVRDDWYDRHVHRGARHRDDDDDDRRGRGRGDDRRDGKRDGKHEGKGEGRGRGKD